LALLGSGHGVVGVLTQPDRPRGRGRQITASPVKEAAVAHGLAISQPASLKGESDRLELLSWQPEVLVVVAYGLLVPAAVLAMPRLGCVNIHPSLLPRWRGAAPIQRAVLAGDPETGVCIMQMDAGLDTGPVLLERRTPIGVSETAGALHDRLAGLGAELLLAALDGLALGTLTPHSQAVEGVTYAAKIEKAEGRIDWTRSAQEIDQQIRAFNPAPVAETSLVGETLRIFEARVADVAGSGTPGAVVKGDGDSVLVQCGQGRLALLRVQRPGRRVVAATDLVHSLPLRGERLGL
jgi:methionyl-tRNA formyltransferase